MKLFLIGTLLFSGSGAAAMQNENVNETVTQAYQNVRQRVQKRVKENVYENIRETGFPYPTEERLATLTEDQQFAIISAIDQVNATYDWTNMSDDEIKEALLVVQEDMSTLCEELGIELSDSFLQNRFQNAVRTRTNEIVKGHLLDNLKENGIEYPSEERLANLTEEQSTALVAKIDELNATYDWATMTDDEILDAMVVIKAELQTLNEEFGFLPDRDQIRAGKGSNRGNRNNGQTESEVPVEGADEA